MDGKFLASGETVVRTESGSLATIVETPLEDATFAAWERGEFTQEQQEWATRFRKQTEKRLTPKFYAESIARAGIPFSPPQTDEELIAVVEDLLANRKLLPKLFTILSREFGIPSQSINDVTKRWYRAGREPFAEFAPYAFFCLKASFLWNLGLTNPELFTPDRNDRKDLEYCYYLPNTEVFTSKDKKHKRLGPALLRADQSFIDGDELKTDLRRISEEWETLSKEEQIALNSKRGDAPPENEMSSIYRLWKKHGGEINPSMHKEMAGVKLVDSSLPKEAQVQFTFDEFVQKKTKEIRNGKRLSAKELDELDEIHKGQDPTTMLMFTSRVSRERLRKWHPELTEADLEKDNSDERSEVYLDPHEYRNLIFC